LEAAFVSLWGHSAEKLELQSLQDFDQRILRVFTGASGYHTRRNEHRNEEQGNQQIMHFDSLPEAALPPLTESECYSSRFPAIALLRPRRTEVPLPMTLLWELNRVQSSSAT
jgi:hypothetical protein